RRPLKPRLLSPGGEQAKCEGVFQTDVRKLGRGCPGGRAIPALECRLKIACLCPCEVTGTHVRSAPAETKLLPANRSSCPSRAPGKAAEKSEKGSLPWTPSPPKWLSKAPFPLRT